MIGLLGGKQYDGVVSRLDAVQECDRQTGTYRQTDRQTDRTVIPDTALCISVAR